MEAFKLVVLSCSLSVHDIALLKTILLTIILDLVDLARVICHFWLRAPDLCTIFPALLPEPAQIMISTRE
jgi:hypothetical protein